MKDQQPQGAPWGFVAKLALVNGAAFLLVIVLLILLARK